jgi:hypothetical protein
MRAIMGSPLEAVKRKFLRSPRSRRFSVRHFQLTLPCCTAYKSNVPAAEAFSFL